MSAFPFIGQAYQSRSTNIEAQECVNLYLEADPAGRNALIGTPGTTLFATVGTGPIRGIYKPPIGDVIVASGTGIYRLKADGSSTLLGSIGSSTGVVSMADNGLAVVIVDGSAAGYTVSLTSYSFAPISSPAFYGSDNVSFLDGRFIFNRPRTGQFYVSDLYATTFNALYFATAEASPDNIISHIVDHREIWLLGDLTGEIWFNSGAPQFPYERLQGATIETGCAASHSLCRMDNTVVWLGKDEKGQGIVWQAKNYSPARISTHAIEYAIASYFVISDAIGYVYQQEGHTFYVLTFPTAQKTWVYDAATLSWHQRAYLDPAIGQIRHRSNCHAFGYGRNLVGDYQNGNVYVFDLNATTDNGAAIKWTRSCAPLQSPDFDFVYFKSLQIDFETGVGTQTGQGVDPVVNLSYSDDGGHTWSNELPRGLGKAGQYKQQVRWLRLGRAKDRVFRVTGSDPVKVAIINAAINNSGH